MKCLLQMKDLEALFSASPSQVCADFPIEGYFQPIFHCQSASFDEEHVFEEVRFGELGESPYEFGHFSGVDIGVGRLLNGGPRQGFAGRRGGQTGWIESQRAGTETREQVEVIATSLGVVKAAALTLLQVYYDVESVSEHVAGEYAVNIRRLHAHSARFHLVPSLVSSSTIPRTPSRSRISSAS